jgi:hypothetical protein
VRVAAEKLCRDRGGDCLPLHRFQLVIRHWYHLFSADYRL